jgi:Lectin C-type domain
MASRADGARVGGSLVAADARYTLATPHRPAETAAMGRRGYGLFVAGIPALFAAGALGASCSLETAGITGSGSSASVTPSTSTGAGAGGMGGAGTGGEPPSIDPETCPGADVRLSPISPVTMPGTLKGRNHDVTPSCLKGGMAQPDVIYRVFPETDGTLKVSLEGDGDFKGSLSIRSSCEDSVVPVEFGCDEKTSVQRAWVRANAPYYVVVDGAPSNFSITFTLMKCGDGITQDLEECDGGGCKGCLVCDRAGEFWDDQDKKQRCYKLVTTTASFAAARQGCLDWGGDLAGINDKGELDLVRGTASVTQAGDLWVGGYAREARCSYVWTDGEPGFPWVGFATGEPSSTAGTTSEPCLGLVQSGTPPHGMDDQPCATMRSYLCERAPAGSCGDGVIQAGEECDDANDKSCQNCLMHCESGEFKDGVSHHCYRLIKDAVSWNTAKASCDLSKGYLAVVTSKEENAFIARHVGAALGPGAEIWLGLTSAKKVWHWDRPNEKPLCAPQWQMAQPDPDGMTCATLHEDGVWTAHQCTSAYGYLCERGP